MTAWTESNIPDLTGKRALVTGAASGLGLATATALARKGAAVVLADKNVAGGAAALAQIRTQSPIAQVEFVELDLAELKWIRRFAEAQLAHAAPLDLLINNAGILPPAQRATTRDGFELKFGINHLGHFALTGLLLPTLLRSTEARVISVTSLVQAQGKLHFDDLQSERDYQPQRAYSQAKLACLCFALELHERCVAANSRIKSIAAHPGVARTAIGDTRRSDPGQGLRARMEVRAMDFAMKYFGQPAVRGALPLLYAATATEAQSGDFIGPDGFGQMAGYPKRVKAASAARNAENRVRLWTASEQLTGVTFGALTSN